MTKQLGTPGYYPNCQIWPDGLLKWDIWSLAAIICEADMVKDVYKEIHYEIDAKAKFTEHLAKK